MSDDEELSDVDNVGTDDDFDPQELIIYQELKKKESADGKGDEEDKKLIYNKVSCVIIISIDCF
jgi:hypothetical protein